MSDSDEIRRLMNLIEEYAAELEEETLEEEIPEILKSREDHVARARAKRKKEAAERADKKN